MDGSGVPGTMFRSSLLQEKKITGRERLWPDDGLFVCKYPSYTNRVLQAGMECICETAAVEVVGGEGTQNAMTFNIKT